MCNVELGVMKYYTLVYYTMYLYGVVYGVE